MNNQISSFKNNFSLIRWARPSCPQIRDHNPKIMSLACKLLRVKSIENHSTDPRMMFPDIEGEKMLDNKTILTMDLKFLEELWVPGKG